MLNSQTDLYPEVSLTPVPCTMYDTREAVMRSLMLLLLRLVTRWQCFHVENGVRICRNVAKVKKVALCLSELVFYPNVC